MSSRKYEPVNLTWWLVVVVLLALGVGIRSSDASERYRCGDGSCNDVDIEVEGDEIDVDAQGGDATVGDITIDASTDIPADTTHRAKIELENTPDIVSVTPGSRDGCIAHIGANLSLPGLGTGLTIPLPGRECRKLSYYDRMIDLGELNAAEIIFCGLKEVEKEFRQLDLNCRQTLTIYVAPEEVGSVVLTPDEYDNLVVQSVHRDEYQEDREQVEYRITQQKNLIDSLQQETEADDQEIERLKREAARLRVAEQRREEREMVQQTGFQRLYEKQVAQETERAAQEEEPANE